LAEKFSLELEEGEANLKVFISEQTQWKAGVCLGDWSGGMKDDTQNDS